MTLQEAKAKLDQVIGAARTDFYKPIQIAETLRQRRLGTGVVFAAPATYYNQSLGWRNEVTRKLTGKASSSSQQYQHAVWSIVDPQALEFLNLENSTSGREGMVERYVYDRYSSKQQLIIGVINYVAEANPQTFSLADLLDRFAAGTGMGSSIDRAYEAISYVLLRTAIQAAGVEVTRTVRWDIHDEAHQLLEAPLQAVAGMLKPGEAVVQPGRLFRGGDVNSADSGLDMWANFGTAVQVKHVAMNAAAIGQLLGKLDASEVVVVCKSITEGDRQVAVEKAAQNHKTLRIVQASDLVQWYDQLCASDGSDNWPSMVLGELTHVLQSEFPQAVRFAEFYAERQYAAVHTSPLWAV